MRRKSTRTGKTSPEKGRQTDSPARKSRRASKRRRKSSSGSDNSDEEQDVKHLTDKETSPNETNIKHASDTEKNDDINEKNQSATEEPRDKHDKKIKLKRHRSEGTETSSEEKQSRRSRRHGSPKAEERTHQEDDDEDKKGKGKSKGKTKSKIEKTQPPNESDTHNESEISTNAQVTAQSPQIVNTNLVDNEVDVAENAEDKNSENKQKEEDDSKDCVEAKNNSEVRDELEHSTNDIGIYNSTLEKKKISDEAVENIELPKSDCEKQVNRDSSDGKNVESNLCSEETRKDEIAVNESKDANEENEKSTENAETEAIPTDTSQPIVKSDEDFTGFAKDHPKAKSDSFTEEPMDISLDVTFSLKTDESTIMVTESEETIEGEQRAKNQGMESTPRKLRHSQDSEKSPEKSSVNRKVTIYRDPSLKPTFDRRKGWGSSTIVLDLFTPIQLHTAVIQNIYQNVKFLDESEVKLELDTKDRRKSITEIKQRKRLERSVSSNDSSEYRKFEAPDEEKEQEDNANIIAMNRKISIVDDSASKLKPPPSPAKNSVSSVLFITNLVRPFTLKQLKELLERTGKIKESGFWTDRIKSKCYVQYENNDDAEATRNALHGVHWPIGNGKKLMIDYSTEDELENARNPPATPPLPEPPAKLEKENLEPVKKPKEEEEKSREKLKEKRRHEHVREWDVGKVEMHRGRSRSRERDRIEKRRHPRHSPSPFEDYLARKQKKAEEQIPQKLMDDLFQKTKTTPSIYWQPLSPEEIATKQQQRLERMAEHKRRLEESTRNRADFGRGGPYRRRYD